MDVKGANPNPPPVVPTAKEISILRRLAGEVRARAEHPRTLERRRQWRLLYELKAERPLILAEFGWHEIRPEPLVCEDPLLRSWEDWLRQVIYRFDVVDDDALVWPSFPVQWQIKIYDSHDGHNLPRHVSDDAVGYAYVPLIKDISRLAEEVGRLPHERLEVDREATHRQLELAARIFGDILPPRLYFVPGCYKWSLGLTYDAVHLVGYNEFIMALCDNPDGVHALLAFLRDDWTASLDYMEREGLLTPDWASVNGLGDVTPGGRPTPPGDGQAGLADLWGFAECQEMAVASPRMFEEFIMPYLAPITSRFGYISYGCCEPLDDRLDIVRRYIRNLRKIGVTPWANQECYAHIDSLVLSRRPNPAMVCTRFNEDEIRADIRKTLDILGRCQLELVMKDVVTLQNEAERIPRWVRIVREEIARHYGNV